MIQGDGGAFDGSSLLSGWPHDLRTAARFFTCLPLSDDGAAGGGLGHALRAWPVIGIAIGLAAAITLLILRGLGLGPAVTAITAIALMVGATGALHEDGLADFADGLGGHDVETRLAIMRDSRVGTFGLIALVLCLGLRAAALAELPDPGRAAAALVAAATASRGLVPLMILYLGPARPDGLGAALGAPDRSVVGTAVAIGAAAALILLGPGAGIVALALALAAVAAVAALARRRLGGYTGDVLGAAQQAAEAGLLIGAAMFA